MSDEESDPQDIDIAPESKKRFKPEDITVETDDKGNRTATIRLSKTTTITMREIGGGEFRTVRRLTGRDAQMITDNLALYALTVVNGEKLVPVANEMHLQSRSRKFSLREYSDLPAAYDEAFNPYGDDEKNG